MLCNIKKIEKWDNNNSKKNNTIQYFIVNIYFNIVLRERIIILYMML